MISLRTCDINMSITIRENYHNDKNMQYLIVLYKYYY